ncbi:hypothetical protein [Pseudoalteromonas ruthenica]|uniref:hypothetical protein n=1 Tax=Pseudoalteromonas ruthenica TaxID=151081 RepID=UPI00110BFBF8|nr:hypothetical protein [Pseudoalteromonas ruthenica]TMO49417.1 hypothetical protein CWC24_01245 [Pseudoalteromonas ruthenica]TMO50065.1 hypothetical protein CWC23_12735 [Pseudoalteromonas ruthenica]
MRTSVIILLALLLCASSSFSPHLASHLAANSASYLGYWHRYQPHSIDYQSLDQAQLRVLAGQSVAPAQLALAVKLLNDHRIEDATPYWQAALSHQNDTQAVQWQQLTKRLLLNKQWHSLTTISQHRALSEEVAQPLLMHQGVPPSRITTDYAQHHDFEVRLGAIKARQCDYNILLLADHAQGIERLKQLRERYVAKAEPQPGLMCLSKPVYMGSQLDCTSSRGEYARCNWQPLAEQPSRLPPGFDFIVMMTKQGRANVQAGVMQLSTEAPYHVFLHELMHFAGFTDEYPGPKAQQHACTDKGQIYANLYVDDTRPSGWYKSDFCNNGRGYKPTDKISIMQHSEVGLSPLYRRLWVKQLRQHSDELLRYQDYFHRLSALPIWLQRHPLATHGAGEGRTTINQANN